MIDKLIEHVRSLPISQLTGQNIHAALAFFGCQHEAIVIIIDVLISRGLANHVDDVLDGYPPLKSLLPCTRMNIVCRWFKILVKVGHGKILIRNVFRRHRSQLIRAICGCDWRMMIGECYFEDDPKYIALHGIYSGDRDAIMYAYKMGYDISSLIFNARDVGIYEFVRELSLKKDPSLNLSSQALGMVPQFVHDDRAVILKYIVKREGCDLKSVKISVDAFKDQLYCSHGRGTITKSSTELVDFLLRNSILDGNIYGSFINRLILDGYFPPKRVWDNIDDKDMLNALDISRMILDRPTGMKFSQGFMDIMIVSRP